MARVGDWLEGKRGSSHPPEFERGQGGLPEQELYDYIVPALPELLDNLDQEREIWGTPPFPALEAEEGGRSGAAYRSYPAESYVSIQEHIKYIKQGNASITTFPEYDLSIYEGGLMPDLLALRRVVRESRLLMVAYTERGALVDFVFVPETWYAPTKFRYPQRVDVRPLLDRLRQAFPGNAEANWGGKYAYMGVHFGAGGGVLSPLSLTRKQADRLKAIFLEFFSDTSIEPPNRETETTDESMNPPKIGMS